MLGRDLDHAEPHGPEASAYSNIAGQMRAMRFRQCFPARRSVLHIAAEQNNKGIALPEDLRSSHRTGTAWVIDKILVYLKKSFIVAVKLNTQKV